jgi:hypothetical protein
MSFRFCVSPAIVFSPMCAREILFTYKAVRECWALLRGSKERKGFLITIFKSLTWFFWRPKGLVSLLFSSVSVGFRLFGIPPLIHLYYHSCAWIQLNFLTIQAPTYKDRYFIDFQKKQFFFNISITIVVLNAKIVVRNFLPKSVETVILC